MTYRSHSGQRASGEPIRTIVSKSGAPRLVGVSGECRRRGSTPPRHHLGIGTVMSTTIVWKVFTQVGRRIANAADADSIAFKATPNTGVYTQFSLPLSYAYVPLSLVPTATYHQVLGNRMRSRGFPWPSKKPAYRVLLPGIEESRLSVKVRLYPPDILAMTFRLFINSDVRLGEDFSKLREWRFPLDIPVIREIASFTAGIIDSGDYRRPTLGLRLTPYTGYYLEPVADGRNMRALISADNKLLTGLLLGVQRWQGISDDLVSSVMAENAELNKKESDELLLLNKQGQVFLALPDDEFTVPRLERFDLTLDIVEIGRVFQLFLDNFSHIRLNQEDFADYIFAQMDGWIRRSAAIFAASYTSQMAWDMIVRAFRLVEKLSLTVESNPGLMHDIEEKRVFFAQATDHWWERPEFAATFDSAKFRATRTLTRITDTDLRFRIITYLREAEMSLAGRNYNAAVVMSGSAVEAMLLAVLEQDTSLNSKTLRNQGLKDYIELARAHHLVRDTALLNILDNSLREWRNFVHPGKALRTGVNLTEGNAKIVVTAANELANALLHKLALSLSGIDP
jgi:hypothetical protein